MALTPLYSYKGRKFVLLCSCNSDWYADRVKWIVTKKARQMFYPTETCSKCIMFPWIILPKREVFDDKADISR